MSNLDTERYVDVEAIDTDEDDDARRLAIIRQQRCHRRRTQTERGRKSQKRFDYPSMSLKFRNSRGNRKEAKEVTDSKSSNAKKRDRQTRHSLDAIMWSDMHDEDGFVLFVDGRLVACLEDWVECGGDLYDYIWGADPDIFDDEVEEAAFVV